MLILRPILLAALIGCSLAGAVRAEGQDPRDVLVRWNRLVLELVRHTPTYSPPVASRAFAYLGVTGYEATASGDPSMTSLAGQLPGLTPPPRREDGAPYDEAIVLHAALAEAAHHFFANTGPTGQRAMKALGEKQGAALAAATDKDTAARSAAYGQAIAAHIAAWAEADGGAQVKNLGFPPAYPAADGPGDWVPTNSQSLQQTPLLPGWGENRPFAMPSNAACDLPFPPAYSEDAASTFYAQARETYDVARALTDEQKLIARFWSDDPMLSPTPPGHWIHIALSLIETNDLDQRRSVDLMARLGIAMADAFIACWRTKYDHDLLRPVTYINRVIDKDWKPLLITPPFPEYPSGHSSQSGAAAEVLTAIFGDMAFDDDTHADDGLPVRHFANFRAAAAEAAISRLYGGIHFRAAIDRGLDQGRCVAAHVAALRTLQ